MRLGRSIVISEPAIGCYDIQDDWEGLDAGHVVGEFVLKGDEARIPGAGHQRII